MQTPDPTPATGAPETPVSEADAPAAHMTRRGLNRLYGAPPSGPWEAPAMTRTKQERRRKAQSRKRSQQSKRRQQARAQR